MRRWAGAAAAAAAGTGAGQQDVPRLWPQLRRELQLWRMQRQARLLFRGALHGAVQFGTQRQMVWRWAGAAAISSCTGAWQLPGRQPHQLRGTLPGFAPCCEAGLRQGLREAVRRWAGAAAAGAAAAASARARAAIATFTTTTPNPRR